MKIAVSTDERTHLVDVVLEQLRQRGHEVEYFGPEAGQEADWPEVTARAVERVASEDADEAIVMCWTGTGCTIAANKVPGIRAALCHDAETAKGARVWNHANVLGLSLRATPEGVAREILDAWFDTPYSTDEWNLRQMQRIRDLERQYGGARAAASAKPRDAAERAPDATD
jgi:ribose 5-phosphate isomerase B